MTDRPYDPLRRAILIGAATGAVASAGGAAAATRHLAMADLKKEADIACVYHCDFGEPPRFAQLLTNIANHYSVYGSDPFALQLAIVAHGQGVKFFLDSLDNTSWRNEGPFAEMFGRIEDLAKAGLKVHLCEITCERLKLDKAKARLSDFISFVPSGVAAVAALQAKGFGYMKIG
mgnify:CR=1 FL=1